MPSPVPHSSEPQCVPPAGSAYGQGWGLAAYRLVLVLALIAVFSLQEFIQVPSVRRLPGLLEVENNIQTKLALGACVSLLLFAVLVEFASAWLFRRFVRTSSDARLTDDRAGRRVQFAVCLVAGLFLFANLQSRLFAGY